MMAAPLAGLLILVIPSRRKHPLPPPLSARVGILEVQRPRQLYPYRTVGEVALVLRCHRREMLQQRSLEPLGQHRHPIAIPLPTPDDNLMLREINVLDAQPERLEQPH